MNTKDTPAQANHPLQTLGLSLAASEEEIRLRYLELIKQFPPEREPQRFQEIQTAYRSAKDPLTLARTLLQTPAETVPDWNEVIQQQKSNPPCLGANFVLSLGNIADPPQED